MLCSLTFSFNPKIASLLLLCKLVFLHSLIYYVLLSTFCVNFLLLYALYTVVFLLYFAYFTTDSHSQPIYQLCSLFSFFLLVVRSRCYRSRKPKIHTQHYTQLHALSLRTNTLDYSCIREMKIFSHYLHCKQVFRFSFVDLTHFLIGFHAVFTSSTYFSDCFALFQ